MCQVALERQTNATRLDTGHVKMMGRRRQPSHREPPTDAQQRRPLSSSLVGAPIAPEPQSKAMRCGRHKLLLVEQRRSNARCYVTDGACKEFCVFEPYDYLDER